MAIHVFQCQIQDFLSQSIEVTVGSYIQAHQFVTHSQSSFLRQDQFLPINGAGKDWDYVMLIDNI